VTRQALGEKKRRQLSQLCGREIEWALVRGGGGGHDWAACKFKDDPGKYASSWVNRKTGAIEPYATEVEVDKRTPAEALRDAINAASQHVGEPPNPNGA
jgi:hypothetical protein